MSFISPLNTKCHVYVAVQPRDLSLYSRDGTSQTSLLLHSLRTSLRSPQASVWIPGKLPGRFPR